MAEDGGNEINTEECSQQAEKVEQMPEILQKWMSVMSKLERSHDKSQEIHLSKMKSLHAILTDSKEKLKIETLMECDNVLKKLVEKVDKVPCGQEDSIPGTTHGNTAVGELSKDKSESRAHHTPPRTENPSEILQAGKSSLPEPSSTNDEASLNNEWFPSHKDSTALENMLSPDSLRDLYKCMDGKCYWTDNGARSFLCHIKNEHFNNTNSNWNHCSYCPFQGDGTPQVLVQHITMKHGYCQYQCAYCFFRGMTCNYVVLHQKMFHANKLVRVLQCDDLKISPPAENELEPLESVVQPYICSQGSCEKIFYDPKDFLLHLEQQHSGTSSLTCHICKATCLKAASLISHYKFHSLSLYQCRHCQYGAEKVEEVHKHLCNMHHNLPPLIVLRHYEPSEQSAPNANVNQPKIVSLDPFVLDDVISRLAESAVGGIMTSMQSEIFSDEEDTLVANESGASLFSQITESEIDDMVQKASFEVVENQVTSPILKHASLQKNSLLKISSSLQEINTKRWFCDRSPHRKQDAEKNDDNNVGLHGDDDVEVLYCQFGTKDKDSKQGACLGSCSQARKESPIKELKNSVSELIIETDSEDSSDSVIFIDESWPETTAEEESKLTHEPTTHEDFLASPPNKFSSQFFIRNAESGSIIDSGRKCCEVSVKATDSTDKPQSILDSEGPAVTEHSVSQEGRRKQIMASGLVGEDLYLCGNANCEYRAATKSQLWEHMCVCDLSREGGVQCRHCSQSFKAFSTLINHLSVHGVPRYSCALCTFSAAAPTAVEKHLKHHHKVSCTERVQIDNFFSNPDMDMFVISPKGKGKAKHNPTGHETKSVYRPDEIHILPVSGFLKEPIQCSECSFKTKICSNMKQHLSLHVEQDVDAAEIPTMEALSPVMRLENNQKMFDKLTNLSANSNTGVRKLTSSVTSSSSGFAVNAVCTKLTHGTVVSGSISKGSSHYDCINQPLPPCVSLLGATDDTGKSGEDKQDAASASKSKLTKQAAAQQAEPSIRDSSQPLTPSSPGKEVQNAASPTLTPQQSKRAAAVKARASIRDLSLSTDVAAAIMYQPKMRAAAVRAMASIHDLTEFVLDGSPVSSPKGSYYEDPALRTKEVFTSLPQRKKKTTSKGQKLTCKECGKKCINVRGLKLHIRKTHRRTEKWLCGYCCRGCSTETAIRHHCRKRHPAMPELVKYNDGDTLLTLDDVIHRSMPELVKYDEEATSLKRGKSSLEHNHGLPQKTVNGGSSSSSAKHLESPLHEANRETKHPKLLTGKKAHHCKRKSFRSTHLKLHDESHFNKKFSVAESTAHCFECYECSFEALSLHVLRRHFEMEHQDCEFRYIVKTSKLPRDRSDNVTTKTSAMRHPSTLSTLCDAGHYICMLCNASTDSEEQFHCNHHSVHHPNVEPKYYFETVGHEVKHTKFECQKCCFTSDKFEILKEHLQLHITAFQMWLSAQKCDLETKVVKHKFSDLDCDCTEAELENWTKCVAQGNLKVGESLSPAVAVSEKKDMRSTSEKKDMHSTQCRIQKVCQELTTPSSVSTMPLIKSLPANKSKEDCPEIGLSKNPNTERSYSCYGQTPSPIDENKLMIFTNYGGSCLKMSVSTFSKIHNIHPRVMVQDLKYEKLTPI